MSSNFNQDQPNQADLDIPLDLLIQLLKLFEVETATVVCVSVVEKLVEDVGRRWDMVSFQHDVIEELERLTQIDVT